MTGLIVGAAPLLTACEEPLSTIAEDDLSVGLYPVKRNAIYVLDRKLTPESDATTYNNFYEFGSHKNIRRAAQALPLRPWKYGFKSVKFIARFSFTDTRPETFWEKTGPV